jgi:hypothetical protein
MKCSQSTVSATFDTPKKSGHADVKPYTTCICPTRERSHDMTNDQGWVRVGIDHDTAEFAVATLRGWWRAMGQRVYPKAEELLITVDGGGSNGIRLRLWKLSLQRLADEIGLRIAVCHFPPGTSKLSIRCLIGSPRTGVIVRFGVWK